MYVVDSLNPPLTIAMSTINACDHMPLPLWLASVPRSFPLSLSLSCSHSFSRSHTCTFNCHIHYTCFWCTFFPYVWQCLVMYLHFDLIEFPTDCEIVGLWNTLALLLAQCTVDLSIARQHKCFDWRISNHSYYMPVLYWLCKFVN